MQVTKWQVTFPIWSLILTLICDLCISCVIKCWTDKCWNYFFRCNFTTMRECKVCLAHSFPFNQNKSQNTPTMKMLLRRLKVFYIRWDKDLSDNVSFLAMKMWQNSLICVVNIFKIKEILKIVNIHPGTHTQMEKINLARWKT